MTDRKKLGGATLLLAGVLTQITVFTPIQAGFILNVPVVAQFVGISSDAIFALIPASAPVENSAELVAIIIEVGISLGPEFGFSRTNAIILSLFLATVVIAFRRSNN